jgi:MFS family permease
VLRDRRFALLFATRALSVLGGAFAPVALAFGVLSLPGATASTLSIVLAAEEVPLIAFMLIGGVIGDRFPRDRVMMAGTLLMASAFLSLGLMLLTGWAPLTAMIIASALSGVGMAISFPALTGIVPDVVAAEGLQTANALLGIAANASRIAGFVLGGATVVLIGSGPALLVSAAVFATAAALLAGLRLSLRAGAGGSRSVLAELREGWQEFRSHQWLWVIVAQFSFLVLAFQAAHGVLGPVVAKQDLGGAAAWSAVLSGEAVGTMIGVLIALRYRPTRPMLVATLTTAPMATPFLAMGLNAPLWIVVAGAFVMGVCFDIFGVLWQTTMQREIPAASLSRVSSYDALGSLMFGPIGLLAAGPVAVAVGARPALIGCGVLIVLSTFAALAAPGVRGLTARPAVAAAQA